MNKSSFQVLQLILNDISRNSSQYNESELIKAILQFQNKVLNLRKRDPKINQALKQLTINQISDISNKLNISLENLPRSKNVMVSITSSLISLTKKEEEFLKLIESLVITEAKSKTQRRAKQRTTLSISECQEYRNSWLTSPNPSHLEPQLLSINMNALRKIVQPWQVKPKGRSKKDLAEAIINYVSQMRRLSKLGT